MNDVTELPLQVPLLSSSDIRVKLEKDFDISTRQLVDLPAPEHSYQIKCNPTWIAFVYLIRHSRHAKSLREKSDKRGIRLGRAIPRRLANGFPVEPC